jgi:hypothetical protein
MAKLPPIQTPMGRRWREFRIEYLPYVAFASCVLAAVLLWSEFALPHMCEAPGNDTVSAKPAWTPDASMATVGGVPPPSIPATNTTAAGYSD